MGEIITRSKFFILDRLTEAYPFEKFAVMICRGGKEKAGCR
jgi:hypothetical protein